MNEIHELENDNEKLLRKIQEIETMISKSSGIFFFFIYFFI